MPMRLQAEAHTAAHWVSLQSVPQTSGHISTGKVQQVGHHITINPTHKQMPPACVSEPRHQPADTLLPTASAALSRWAYLGSAAVAASMLLRPAHFSTSSSSERVMDLQYRQVQDNSQSTKKELQVAAWAAPALPPTHKRVSMTLHVYRMCFRYISLES